MSTSNYSKNISLLWPDGDVTDERSLIKITDSAFTDIGISEVIEAISINNRYSGNIKSILAKACQDKSVLNYRLDIIEDLLTYSDIVDGIESMLPLVNELHNYCNYKGLDDDPIQILVKRLNELDLFTNCILKLKALLSEIIIYKSEGLKRLRNLVVQVTEDESFNSLVEQLPNLKSGIEHLTSVTLGINLSPDLKPVEATLISINAEKFKGEPFINKLVGRKNNDQFTGISRLYSIWDSRSDNKWAYYRQAKTDPKAFLERTAKEEMRDAFKEAITGISRTFEVMLFKELHQVLNVALKPVIAIIDRYAKISSSFLISIEPELAFYIGVVKLIRRMKLMGLTMCRPEFVSKEERIFSIENLYNINLAIRKSNNLSEGELRKIIVTNDISFDDNNRIFILTGPNRGGKTTFIQAIALCQILFHIGIFVPGDNARISPVDSIFTHFPAEEKSNDDTGRLGEEAKRLGDIFQKASRYSFILLNESLVSTSPGESLYMSKDIVRALRLLGVRAIFATHLHDLASDLELINTEIYGDSKIASLVAGVKSDNVKNSENGTQLSEEHYKRTYKIVHSQPLGRSFARDIANQYGISFEKLSGIIVERNKV